MTQAACHPERQHYGKTFCKPCYMRNRSRNNHSAQCHPEKPMYAKGLCKACHQAGWLAGSPEKYEQHKSSVMRRWGTMEVTAKQAVYLARRLKQYGITEECYHELLASQSAACGVCSVGISGFDANNRLLACIDHEHDTGRVRGLLCMNCNAGIGQLGDTVEGLQRAIEYLKRSNP